MPMHRIQPYLFFEGRCEEALEFYKDAVGAKVEMLMRYKEAPPPPAGQEPQGCEGQTPPGDAVMHAAFLVGDTLVMASDGMASGKPEFKGFALTVNATSDAEADKLYAALSTGGQPTMPLVETFFATRFGMLTDKFGVGWMVINARPM